MLQEESIACQSVIDRGCFCCRRSWVISQRRLGGRMRRQCGMHVMSIWLLLCCWCCCSLSILFHLSSGSNNSPRMTSCLSVCLSVWLSVCLSLCCWCCCCLLILFRLSSGSNKSPRMTSCLSVCLLMGEGIGEPEMEELVPEWGLRRNIGSWFQRQDEHNESSDQ